MKVGQEPGDQERNQGVMEQSLQGYLQSVETNERHWLRQLQQELQVQISSFEFLLKE